MSLSSEFGNELGPMQSVHAFAAVLVHTGFTRLLHNAGETPLPLALGAGIAASKSFED
jgi:hypothetical protein